MILINGAASDTLPVIDRGIAYGDGVFRTLAIRGGHPRCWRRQFGKLAHDCGALGIRCPEGDVLRREVSLVAQGNTNCAAKIIVTRGVGQRGYAPAPSVAPTRIVMSFPAPAYPDDFAGNGVKARICGLRLAFQPALAGLKHLNRLENVLARAEWDDPEIAEGLLLDGEGNVIGGTMTNLFILENEVLFTPDLSRCGVAGVTRERVIDAAARAGITCRIERISVDRLTGADEVLLVNSLIGVWRIRELGMARWRSGTLAARVRQWLDEDDD